MIGNKVADDPSEMIFVQTFPPRLSKLNTGVLPAAPVLDGVVNGSQPGVEACSQVCAPALQGGFSGGVGRQFVDLVQEPPDLGPELLQTWRWFVDD